MKKLTIKGHIVYDKFWASVGDDTGGFVDGFTFTTYCPEGDAQKVLVSDHEVEIEVPDNFDPRPGLVKNLEKEKERVRAEFSAKVVDIDRQINQLLAIEA